MLTLKERVSFSGGLLAGSDDDDLSDDETAELAFAVASAPAAVRKFLSSTEPSKQTTTSLPTRRAPAREISSGSRHPHTLQAPCNMTSMG